MSALNHRPSSHTQSGASARRFLETARLSARERPLLSMITSEASAPAAAPGPSASPPDRPPDASPRPRTRIPAAGECRVSFVAEGDQLGPPRLAMKAGATPSPGSSRSGSRRGAIHASRGGWSHRSMRSPPPARCKSFPPHRPAPWPLVPPPRRGDYDQVTAFITTTRWPGFCKWQSRGARACHLVDLDGARERRAANDRSWAITNALAISGAPWGGGVAQRPSGPRPC